MGFWLEPRLQRIGTGHRVFVSGNFEFSSLRFVNGGASIPFAQKRLQQELCPNWGHLPPFLLLRGDKDYWGRRRPG
jgi:hypothetical protein